MICVDASLAAKWLFPEPYSDEARALFISTVSASERIVAPSLLPIEVTNLIRQRMRGARRPQEQPLSLLQARQVLRIFLAFPIELIMPAQLHRQALDLAAVHGLPAVYDAHYVALAQMFDCMLWTADRNLVNALQAELSFVRWLGDFRATEQP